MKNKIHMLTFALLILILTLAIPLPAQATEYFVDKNHPSASDTNPGTEALPWKTITKANQTLSAGDTVYIKAGTYTNYIAPNNSGTSDSNRITYRNFVSDTVTISNQSYGIYLNSDDYITVQGINFTNTQYGMELSNSDYNIIDTCTFGPQGTYTWDASLIYNGSNYNWVKNSTFYEFGECTGGSDNGYVFAIGLDDFPADTSTYNLIEDNVFYRGGHHVVGLHTRYNVFRNNYVHNEAWTNGKGNRNLYLAGPTSSTGYNLIENNRLGYAAPPCDAAYVAQVNFSTQYNIFRYNSLYHGNAAGIAFYGYGGYSDGSYNKVYNNTFFNNTYQTQAYPAANAAVSFLYAANTGNALKNNLYYSHTKLYGWEGASPGNQTFANEWGNDNDTIDPLFVNASTTPPVDKTNSAIPDLNLQAGSSAINYDSGNGGALTTTTNSGNSSTNLTVGVNQADYFQDGTWGLASEVDADWIAVGTVNNTVQISSISGDTITLASPISWNNGDSVWLYKDSDGTQVLYGSAPDAGAYEFLQAAGPSPPKNLKIIE